MADPLRALIVEDVEADALLLVRELKRGGFDVTFERVDTPESMSAALDEKPWDVVLSDYSMPRFSALAALALVKERKLDLPFIIVSGTVGEETAVEAIRAGAHDFMVKGKFARLIPAIERERRDAELRAAKASMQQQLIISDRMATMGTLAAGVAHEINNPLAALMANLDFATQDVARLLEDTRGPGDRGDDVPAGARWGARLGEIEDSLRDACEAAERVRLIVRDLKIFSRSDEERTGAVDVRPVLESSLRMAWNEIRHRAVLVKELGEVPSVHGNEGRLGQVFLNVLINAAQAIAAGRADHNEIRVVARADGQGSVVVEVHDSGSGIPEAVRSEIFDPFFTTKPIGTGTGLGLAICRQIVTAYGGRIEVESEVGEGTTMRIVLPAATGEPVAAVSEPDVIASSRRRGRVLVIDDEPFLGKAVTRMLSGEHEVTTVTSARAAGVRIAAGERFDIILCDLMMPDMTGMELHAQLVQAAPHQAESMVFMTGGAFTAQAREYLERIPNQRIDKPFEAAALRSLVHRHLERRASHEADDDQ